MSGGGWNFNPFGGRAGNSDRHGQDDEGMTDQGQGASRGNVLFGEEVDEKEYDFLERGSQGATVNVSQLIIATRVWDPNGEGTPNVPQLIIITAPKASRRQAVFQPRGNPQPDTIGTRPPARPDVWLGQQGMGQRRGEGLGQGQGLPRQRNQELPENLGAPAGANNAGAAPQGLPAHQGAAGNQGGDGRA